MFKVFQALFALGVSKDDVGSLPKQIFLTNVLVVVTIFASFPYFIFHLLVGSKWLAALILLTSLSLCLVPLMNKAGHTSLSRIFFLTVINLSLYFVSAILGKGVDVHLLFFPFTVFTIVIFGLREVRAIAFGIALPASLYYLLNNTGFYFPYKFPLSTFATQGLSHSLILLTFLLLSMAVLYAAWLSEQAEKKLENISQAKSSFLANMSHELRTPLNAIIGYSELVEEECDELEAIEMKGDVQRIHKAAYNLLNLVNDILDLSKIEAEQMELEKEDFPCLEFFDEIESLLIPMTKTNKNKLTFDLHEVETIHADRLRLKQIFLNLLSNALKFTENGQISVRMCELVENGVSYWSFEVSDTGVGISQEAMGSLFDAFTQTGEQRNARYQGTGLGLAITRQLCQLMGGEIQVESQLGKGSTFSFKIPQ